MPDNSTKIATSDGETYNADYYASHCGNLVYRREEPEWGRFFGGVADQIVRSLRPLRVFDAGCAHGFLVEALWDRGVETWGRDISHFAFSQVRADLRSFIAQGSIADPIQGEYDLITCIEVLEHMEEAEAVIAIASMAAAAPRLLFSSSPTDLDESTHINVKPIIWWLHRFAKSGMMPVFDYDASFLTPHAYLLERSAEVGSARELNAFAALMRQRMLVHEQAARAPAAMQETVAEAERLRQHAAAVSAAIGATVAEQARLKAIIQEAGYQSIADLKAKLAMARSNRLAAWAERDALLYSTTWRATQPLRRMGKALPIPARRAARRVLRAVYWFATLQFGRRMADRRATLANLPPPSIPILPSLDIEYDRWVRDYDTLRDDDREAIRAHISHLKHQPLISVLMPAYETPERLLREAIASIRAQLYPHWELCVVDDASPSTTVARVMREAAAQDPRIKWMRRDRNGHIAAATNSALTLASGEFVALMDHDDLLPEQALYEVAVELNAYPNTDLIYTDEDQVDSTGHRSQPYFKPNWNIDLQLGHNMFSHLGVYRRTLLEKIGGLREGVVDGSQDYDLVLRSAAASEPARIRHIPAVLYHWRRMDEAASFSQTQLDRCLAAAKRAIADYLNGQGVQGAEILPAPAAPTWNRIRWPLPDPPPRVSLIVPTRDRPDLLAPCVAGLLQRTDYPDFELLIVDNNSSDPQALALLARLQDDHRVRVLPFPKPFNYSALNNAAVREATGEIVVLINNDIDVIDSGWLREMVSLTIRPDVGAVGAKLLYADGRIQHAGVVLGVGHHAGGPGVAGHFGQFAGGHETGHFGQYVMTRELSAVTGACLALRKEVYEAVGGLNAEQLTVAFNDIDLCLRIRESGLRVVWTPFAELYHLESASRGQDRTPEQIARAMAEADYMRDRWGNLLDNDPFYNPNFRRDSHIGRLAIPSRREKPWRQQRI